MITPISISFDEERKIVDTIQGMPRSIILKFIELYPQTIERNTNYFNLPPILNKPLYPIKIDLCHSEPGVALLWGVNITSIDDFWRDWAQYRQLMIFT